MNTIRTRRLVIITALVGASASGAAQAASASASPQTAPANRAPASRTWTPNDCVRQNQGDYVACNVGNNGRGDLPYRVVGVQAP